MVAAAALFRWARDIFLRLSRTQDARIRRRSNDSAVQARPRTTQGGAETKYWPSLSRQTATAEPVVPYHHVYGRQGQASDDEPTERDLACQWVRRHHVQGAPATETPAARAGTQI
eukprot:927502-Rhodomonas_salina.1